MRSWLAGWVPLLRIARRDALRARGRSALIVAMIALPVLALSGVDVLARSAQLDPDEELSRTIGASQALLRGAIAALEQMPDPKDGWSEMAFDGGSTDAPPEEADPRALAPAGYRVLSRQQGGVEARTANGVAQTGWNEAAVGDPGFAGLFRVDEGRAAESGSEVAATSRLLERLGAEVGDEVELTSPAGRYTVTGVVHQVGEPADESFWAAPGTLIGNGIEAYEGGATEAYLVGERPLGWAEVMALNEQRVLVTSRAVITDPPADSEVPFLATNDTGSSSADVVFVVMLLGVVVVLGGLEVTLLAGAAFAVGARRQARSLGLVAAAGGSSTQVRRVVLSGGLVLGTVAAFAGVGLGVLLAAAVAPVLERVTETEFGHFDVRPMELLAIAGVGLVTGLLSAVLPARTAARQDPVVALTGRRGQVRTPRKVPVIGLVLVVAGVGAAAVGSALAVALTTGLNPAYGSRTALVVGLIGGGAALAQIGLIVTSPSIIGLAGRLSSRLPLPGRLALRDAARHRGRSAPAMAAVLTAVTGGTALLLYVTALDAHDREQYHPSWPERTGGVSLTDYGFDAAGQTDTPTSLDPDRLEGMLAPELPAFTATVVSTPEDDCAKDACGWVVATTPEERTCFLVDLDRAPTVKEQRRADADRRCQATEDTGASYGSIDHPVGGGSVLRLVTGSAPPRAVEVLDRGGVAVTDRNLVLNGTVTFDIVTAEDAQTAQDEGRDPVVRQVRLPGVHVPSHAAAGTVLSPGAAKELGLTVRPDTLVMQFVRVPSGDEVDAAAGVLEEAGVEPWSFTVERGYTSTYGPGLLALMAAAAIITLGATGVATGLAQADARADHATLAAVGAAPGLRRTLAAAQSLAIAGLGTALGIAAGFVPAVALIGSVESLDLVIPWVRLLVLLAAVPLLAGVLAWLLTRSRVPLERRVA